MNPFQNGTEMKTFRISTVIWGNQNYQKVKNILVSKNLKEVFNNSKVLKNSYQTKSNKDWRTYCCDTWNFDMQKHFDMSGLGGKVW